VVREKVIAEGVYKGIKQGKIGNFVLCRHDSNYINIRVQAFGDMKCDCEILGKHYSRSV